MLEFLKFLEIRKLSLEAVSYKKVCVISNISRDSPRADSLFFCFLQSFAASCSFHIAVYFKLLLGQRTIFSSLLLQQSLLIHAPMLIPHFVPLPNGLFHLFRVLVMSLS